MFGVARPPAPLPSSDLLDGRYRLIERLGRGGMATVWRAQDERLSRTVAVKILDARLPDDPAGRLRVRAEARALARLSHRHIADVYDFGTPDNAAPYLVMELVEGPSLASVLTERAALPWRAALSVCAQVADALAAAHTRGVVHRDVTTANVMLTPAGVKLIDFGICALEGQQQTDADGQLLGTPAYTAPERLHGQPVAAAADVYSVGSLLYRTLSGRPPWQAATPEQLLLAGQRQEPDPLPPIDGLPGGIADACMRCLDRDPDRRPTAAELAHRLNDALGTAAPADPSWSVTGNGRDDMTRVLPWTATTSVAPTYRWTRRPGSVRGISVVAATLAAGALAWLATNWGPTGEPVISQQHGAPAPSRGPQCAVTYRVTGDTGDHFTATISVTNTGAQQPPGWRLALEVPGDQRIDPGQAPAWSQTGMTVTSAPQPTKLATGDAAQLALDGDYSGANPLPTVFRLDNQTCAATVLGPPGASPPAGNPGPGTTGGSKDQTDAGDKGDAKNKDNGKGNHHGNDKP